MADQQRAEPSPIGDWSGRRCPRCNAETLANEMGDEWCSYVSCTWGFDEIASRDGGTGLSRPALSCPMVSRTTDAVPSDRVGPDQFVSRSPQKEQS